LRPYVSRRAESGSDIDKVLRECFIRIHGGIVRDRDGERLLRWIYRTVDDVIVDSVRVRVAKGPRSAEVHDGARGRDEETLRAALSELVERLIRGLPQPYRETITLTELDGRTHQEAASALGLSFAATRERVRRGRQKIRDTFDECCRVAFVVSYMAMNVLGLFVSTPLMPPGTSLACHVGGFTCGVAAVLLAEARGVRWVVARASS